MNQQRAKHSISKPDLASNDVHVIVNDWERGDRYTGEAKCYDPDGKLRWNIPALCKGVDGPRWTVRGGDTPPGLYLAGQLFETQEHEPDHIWRSYGRWCIDMIEQQEQESKVGRAGICWHGGGSGAPDPMADYQPLLPTLGCVRSHNKDMDLFVVLTLRQVRERGGKMWITVNQIQ